MYMILQYYYYYHYYCQILLLYQNIASTLLVQHNQISMRVSSES